MMVTELELPLVTFVSTTVVGAEVITSSSTLRFCDRPEVGQDLRDHGFDVINVRQAPDRPGKELVFIARRTHYWDPICRRRPRDLPALD